MEKHINKKIIIAILFATVMIMAGFTGLMYYKPENKLQSKNNIIQSTMNEYSLKNINEMKQYEIKSKSNANNVRIVETFYKGSLYKGYTLSTYTNNKLQSSLFVIMNNNETNFVIIPVKSDTLKNTMIINNKTLADMNSKSNNITPDTAALLCYSLYLKLNSNGNLKGEVISLDQLNTGRLLNYLGLGFTLSGVARVLLGSAAKITSVALSALAKTLTYAFAVGFITAVVIKTVDGYGGNVGVYIGYNTGWFNVPYPIFSYNPVPNGYFYHSERENPPHLWVG